MRKTKPVKPVGYAELTVRDATGQTFTFGYMVSTKSAAISKFKENCKRVGITGFKNIKIIKVVLY